MVDYATLYSEAVPLSKGHLPEHHQGAPHALEPASFWGLNQISEFNSYPLPQVDDLMECLEKAQFIFILDLTKGYWQVALAPDAKLKNGFQHCQQLLAVPGSSFWPVWSASDLSVPHRHRSSSCPSLQHT
ncbi:hypothetical protein QTP86_015561 [Hemibagrus guttatus]|nr:hypothetical protein QTP86_015561 [Hemibagrus guttatus]